MKKLVSRLAIQRTIDRFSVCAGNSIPYSNANRSTYLCTLCILSYFWPSLTSLGWLGQFGNFWEWIMRSHTTTSLWSMIFSSINRLAWNIAVNCCVCVCLRHSVPHQQRRQKAPATVCWQRHCCYCHSRWAWPRDWCQWMIVPGLV